MTEETARTPARRRVRWWWPLLALFVGVAAVLLVWQAPLLLYPPLAPDAEAPVQAARLQAIATTRAAFVAGLAGLAAIGGLWVNARTVRINQQTLEETRKAQQENQRAQTEALRLQTRALDLQNEGHLTERYSKAVEQLGESDEGKIAVRLGGVYALERIANDSERDHPTVVEVLSAFVRERTREPRPVGEQGEPAPPATDVQAALTALGRLPVRANVPRVDLRGAQLQGAYLFAAQLQEVDLFGAQLQGAGLADAQLQEANLFGAQLQGAYLAGAQLQRAGLAGAQLQRAGLAGAQLQGANLVGADVVQKQLDSADGDDSTRLPEGLQRPAHWTSTG